MYFCAYKFQAKFKFQNKINLAGMKKRIAVAMGGYSSEFEISLLSGELIYQHLDRNKFEVYKAHILTEGWNIIDEQGEKHPIDKADFSVTINQQKIKFDCVFNMIHGDPGENGLLQAYLELLKIPQTSSDSYASALTFNKRDCNSVLRDYGIKTAKHYALQKGDAIDEEEILNKVGLPCFVKANRSGSSFGISKVKSKSEFQSAIAHSFAEDDEILIESFLDGVEVDVGVIKLNGDIIALPVTEIVSENEFFDYDAKYLGESKEITPARITDEQTKKVKELSIKIFKSLRLKGFARTEFILHEGEPHFIEVNTIPGMTANSIVPQQLKAAGISYREFFSDMVEVALTESH